MSIIPQFLYSIYLLSVNLTKTSEICLQPLILPFFKILNTYLDIYQCIHPCIYIFVHLYSICMYKSINTYICIYIHMYMYIIYMICIEYYNVLTLSHLSQD